MRQYKYVLMSKIKNVMADRYVAMFYCRRLAENTPVKRLRVDGCRYLSYMHEDALKYDEFQAAVICMFGLFRTAGGYGTHGGNISRSRASPIDRCLLSTTKAQSDCAKQALFDASSETLPP